MAKIHKDSLLRARRDLRIESVVTYGGPASRQFEGVLPAGEILRLEYEPADSVDAVWLRPERYAELEQAFVSQEVRAERAYCGYVLSCPLDKLTECYDLVNATNQPENQARF